MEKRTIRCYLGLSFLTKFGISFIAAVYATFLMSQGLNLFLVNMVNFVFFITMFICEIPTGAVADVFGRKISFVCSCFLYAIGMFIYAGSHSFFGFALAEMIAAVGRTFASGAFQAWLVDCVRHQGYGGSLNLVFSKEQQLGQLGLIIGAICGAFLADKNMALPWVVAGFIMLVAGIAAMLLMKEEYFVKQNFSIKNGFLAMKNTAVTSFTYGMKHKVVRFVLVLAVIQFFAVQAPNMQWQPFFSQFLSNKTQLGFVFALIAIAMGVGSALAPWFLKKTKSEEKALLVSQAIIGVGVIATVFFDWFPAALSMFIVHEMARGLFKPIKDVYLNDHIPSKERATLISFESLFAHIGGAIGLFVSGLMAEKISIPFTWVFSGAVLICSSLWLMKNLSKK